MTPRKFKAQLNVHEDIQRQMNGAAPQRKGIAPMQPGYIDQLKGW